MPGGSIKGLPIGKIGNVEISRMFTGGNLISGFAHSRDLIYVSPLLKNYFTDDKVMETFEICEESGINTAEALAMSPHGIVAEIDGLLHEFACGYLGCGIVWIVYPEDLRPGGQIPRYPAQVGIEVIFLDEGKILAPSLPGPGAGSVGGVTWIGY